MVLSYTMTVMGLFVLRWKRPEIPRPYRCTGYPWLPGDLCADWYGVDAEHDHHSADGGLLGNGDCADRGARVFVLEADQQESSSCGVKNV